LYQGRPTFAEIDLRAIARNLERVRDRVSPAAVMAVVKANAYGHGVERVSQAVFKDKAEYLGAACIEEAVALRRSDVQSPILVFSGAGLNQAAPYIEHDIEATVYDETGLDNLQRAAAAHNREVAVHVKVDTGMGRLGVPWRSALEFVQRTQRTPGVRIQGLYTHFATSDHLDKSYALLQLSRFQQFLEQVKRAGMRIPLIHAANSGAILDLPESYFDMVRPGILLYGHYPSGGTTESIALEPAMNFKTRVLFLKPLGRGESVSYDRLFIAPEPTRVATLPAGYADGYNRLLSGAGEVMIRGTRYPVIGRVCMDLLVVDVGLSDPVQVGDEVLLFGRGDGDEIPLSVLCQACGTIPYEVLCGISARVPRVYKETGR